MLTHLSRQGAHLARSEHHISFEGDNGASSLLLTSIAGVRLSQAAVLSSAPHIRFRWGNSSSQAKDPHCPPPPQRGAGCACPEASGEAAHEPTQVRLPFYTFLGNCDIIIRKRKKYHRCLFQSSAFPLLQASHYACEKEGHWNAKRSYLHTSSSEYA
jgi:hypothetical protein